MFANLNSNVVYADENGGENLIVEVEKNIVYPQKVINGVTRAVPDSITLSSTVRFSTSDTRVLVAKGIITATFVWMDGLYVYVQGNPTYSITVYDSSYELHCPNGIEYSQGTEWAYVCADFIATRRSDGYIVGEARAIKGCSMYGETE